jgi:hypothetical protein
VNQVLVLEDGFEFDGRRYPAQMTAAASRIRIQLALPETKRMPRIRAPANSGAFLVSSRHYNASLASHREY